MTTTPFQHLLAAHVVAVHRTALGYLRDEQEAREVAQEALLKAYRARDRYDPERPFGPWLRRIVRNTCLDAVARRKHRAVSGLDTERVESPAPSAPDALDAARRHARLAAALDRLAPEHAEIVRMRHFEDLTYAEIARALDVPQGTVMSRLYRARKALARLLEEP